jgi:hypothetical protein
MAKKSQAEFLVYLTSTRLGQLAFTEMTGGEQNRSIEEYPDAERDESGYTMGTAKYTPITLSTPYDPDIHDAFLSNLNGFCIGEGDDIQVLAQPIKICPEQTTDGMARVYSGCLPSNTKYPDIKRGTSGTATFSVTVNPQRMKYTNG